MSVLINVDDERTITLENSTEHTFNLDILRDGSVYQKIFKMLNVKVKKSADGKATTKNDIDIDTELNPEMITAFENLYDETILSVSGYDYEKTINGKKEKGNLSDFENWKKYVPVTHKAEAFSTLFQSLSSKN